MMFRVLSCMVIAVFGSVAVLPLSSAQSTYESSLPAPGDMVGVSPRHTPIMISGITVYPDNPLKMDFIVDSGDDVFEGEALKHESQRLIHYFLTAMTVPDDELWVNLSPYEKDRIIADGLSVTEMGRDLLAQDYLLKQLTASLMYPEEEFGQDFWKKVYARAQAKLGTTDIPANTFNKIWIVPDQATVYIHNQSIFVGEGHLKVLLEEDYLAMEANVGHTAHGVGHVTKDDMGVLSDEAKDVIRSVLIPEIEREVNEGQNFSRLRQMFHAIILASWYKNNLKKSLLVQSYAGRNKVDGIDQVDEDVKNVIYQQYIQAFEQGVYNYVKEDYDEVSRQVIPRKYFSGGYNFKEVNERDATGNETRAVVAQRFADEGVEYKEQINLSVQGGEDVQGDRSDDRAMLVKSGMAFIFGTGNNGIAVDGNGEVYTDGGALLETGHNMLFKASTQTWVFTGKQMRGDKPSLTNGGREEGDVSFEESFSGPNLARKFARYPGAVDVARKFIHVFDFPEGIEGIDGLLSLLQRTPSEEEKALVAQAINMLLISISKAVAAEDELALKFVRENGFAAGQAIASMFKEYVDDAWVENFVLVSGVGENLARVDGKEGEDDVFIGSIRQGVRDALKKAGVSADRINVISQGIVRSQISWEREVLAAHMTPQNLKNLSVLGENASEAASIGISLGGTKIGAGLVALDGSITQRPDEIQWKQLSRYNDGTSEGIVRGIIDQIGHVVETDGVGIERIKKIGVAFAGPVDRENGIVGTPFPAPNLPFDQYNLKVALKEQLQSIYGHQLSAHLIIDIYNDGAAAVLGETSPQGRLAVSNKRPSDGSPYGGIDFNTQGLDLREQGQAAGIEFIGQPSLLPDTVNGITPVILQITPIENYPSLIGKVDD